jgi:methionyl-tRNA synthetase
MSKTFFISTAIPYVNARPHIGHALEFVQADAWARFYRSLGRDVFFATGTDENALKNVQAAEAAGLPVKQFVEENAETFKKFAGLYNIQYSDFIRTASEKRHIEGAKKFWGNFKPEDIYKKKYAGLYCVGCESFKTEKDLISDRCPYHQNRELAHVEEENYFFRLSNYQKGLEELIVSGKLLITPESKRNEILNFIRSGLEDLSISRSQERAKNWGVAVPNDETQIMYVWVEALSNYIQILDYAIEGENFKKYWIDAEKIVHIVGKDINRFHTVYWPIFLLSAGLKLPDTVFVHGFITLEGRKMSKSTGNTVDPIKLVEQYGIDPVRYYLLREIPAHDDGDWSEERFQERYNADLSNGIGNFASRVLTLAHKIGEIEISPDPDIEKRIVETKKVIFDKMENFRFNEALTALWELITFGDGYVNDKKPWETNDKKVIGNLVILLREIAKQLSPFLPETGEKILSAIARTESTITARKIAPLFPRLN